jgi:hypothetical protein
MFHAALSHLLALTLGAAPVNGPDLSSVPVDLELPEMVEGPPAPGMRVRATAPGFEGGAAYHALYLPLDWREGVKMPMFVEYPGNGGYTNKFGDVCGGVPEGCALGYGLSGGRGFVWLALPFVEIREGRPAVARKWWGDIEQTKRYCLAAIDDAVARFGCDRSRVILGGFSRGAIACNYIGLHDDEIAERWCAFFCHSHYDGVIERWPYAGADRASALERLRRLKGRPQWISQEGSTAATETYLRETGIAGDFVFRAIPFRNHSDRWVLRDLPERRAAREWLETSSRAGSR